MKIKSTTLLYAIVIIPSLGLLGCDMGSSRDSLRSSYEASSSSVRSELICGKNTIEGLLSSWPVFERKIQSFRQFEYEARALEKKVAKLKSELIDERKKVAALQEELQSLRAERVRTLASINHAVDLYDKGVARYKANEYASALKYFDAYLKVGSKNEERGPKALLWKSLSHAKLKQWPKYEQSVKRLKDLHPLSPEAQFVKQEL
jgi:tetratricopeptide (TPR) repeat protein